MDTDLQKHWNTNSKKDSFNIIHQTSGGLSNKLCLFASYSFTGEVAEYVFHYLSAIKKEGYSLAFISTSCIKENCLTKLKENCSLVIERENAGLDFASWQCGLKVYDWAKDFTQVLIANDSVFGPFKPLGPILSSMNKRCDVWGMTDNYDIDYHIQSYFVHFNEKVIRSTAWLSFWQNMNTTGIPKDEIIKQYEVGLSRRMLDAGFKLGVHTSIDTLTRNIGGNDKEISPPLVYWKALIRNFDFPFLKRELLISTTIPKAYWHRNIYINTANWRQILGRESDYPVTLIDNFLEQYFNQITSSDKKIKMRKKKIIFLSEGTENSGSQKVLLSFLQWLKKEKDATFELIVSTQKVNTTLVEDFLKLSAITFFGDLSNEGKVELKERLSNESVGLVFSDTIANVEIQKFLLFLNVPQVIYAHSLGSGNKAFSLESNKHWLQENTAYFIASSPFLQEKLAAFFGKPKEDIGMIPAFINEPIKIQATTKSKELSNLPNEAFCVGICNSLDARMSSDLIPALLAMMCKDHKNIHVVWLGADSSHTSYESLEFNLHRAGIYEQVHLVPTSRTGNQILDYIDVFLLPSNDYTYPLINLEIGLRGIPFICFDHSDTALEYIEAGMGKAVAFLDLKAMCDEVLSYSANKQNLQILKESISQTTKNEFTTGTQAPKVWSLIRNLFDENEMVPEDRPNIAILTHIFYDNTWADIKNKLSFFKDKGAQFLFSISEACLIKDELVEDIYTSFPNSLILTTSNIGKDIGGKFALIDLYLSLEFDSDYVIFLHDKQSPHSLIGESWKNNLQKIIESKNYNQIVRTFEVDEKIGLIGAKEHLISEYDNTNNTFLNNNDKIHEFIKRYNISLSNFEFFGGTMYWMRTVILKNFFKQYNPMEIRAELEAGNVLDNHGSTNAHTWERVLSWVASSQGYRLHGI
jgi:rhamnosyltransferase